VRPQSTSSPRGRKVLKKLESKVLPVCAVKAYRQTIAIAPLILNLSTKWEVNSQVHSLTT
jgi:hypothetical protein